MANLSMIIQCGRFHNWRPGKNLNLDRVIQTTRRRLNSSTVLVNAQAVWDDLLPVSESGEARELIHCPHPPHPDMWLEAVIADGAGQRRIGALVARTGMPGLALSALDPVLAQWYGRGLDSTLPEMVLSKPVATQVDVLHWQATSDRTAVWVGETLYWLDPAGMFLTSTRFVPADGVSPENIGKIRMREEWVLRVFSRMNAANGELATGS
jgi:hypothetical protein